MSLVFLRNDVILQATEFLNGSLIAWPHHRRCCMYFPMRNELHISAAQIMMSHPNSCFGSTETACLPNIPDFFRAGARLSLAQLLDATVNGMRVLRCKLRHLSGIASW